MIAKEMLSLMDNTPKMQMQGQGGSSDSQDDSNQQGKQGQGSSSCQNQQNQEGGQNQNQGSGQDENSNQSSNQNQGSNGGGKTRVAPNGKREKDLCENRLGGETSSMLKSTGREPKDKFEPTSSKKSLEERREEAREKKQIQDDLNQALDEMAKDLFKQQAGDKEVSKALDNIEKETNKCFRVIRPDDWNNNYKNEYKKIKNEVKPIISQASNLINNILKNFEEPENETKLTSGGKVVVKDLWKKDGKCFSQYKEGDEMPDVAFGLVIDGSGSMGSGKMNATIKAAVALKEMCNKLDIPCAVISHSSSSYPIKRFATFSDDTDFQKISQHSGCGSTCDSMGLYVMGEMLLQRPEREKIMIIISDGDPNDIGFDGLNVIKKTKICGGDDAIQETKAVVKGFKKCGVQTYGVALFCYNDIKAIYEKDTIECKNLAELPRKLAKILKNAVVK